MRIYGLKKPGRAKGLSTYGKTSESAKLLSFTRIYEVPVT